MEQPKEEVASSNYSVKDSENHLFHVELDKPGFSPKTGEKLHKPFVQIFNERDFNNFKANAIRLGYELKVLHNPKK